MKVGGKSQIIDRKGIQVGKALDDLVDDAVLSNGVPARLSLTFNSVLLSPDGVRHVATDKMEVVEPFGSDDLFIESGNHSGGIIQQFDAIGRFRQPEGASFLADSKIFLLVLTSVSAD